MNSLSQALYSAQSQDHSTRELSLRTITQMSHADPVSFVFNLSSELANNTSHPSIRQLAAIMLKNTVLNATKDSMLEKVWDRVDLQTKVSIRNNALGSLASEDKDVRLSASQVVATLACLDIPQRQWLDVLGILITNSTNLNKIFKISALRTLGYICDGLSSEFVARDQANMILTAIASNIDPTETDLEIKTVALGAFRNSLKFIKDNMQNPTERDIIMNLLYSCCNDKEVSIRSSSMMIICDVISLYYDEIEPNLIQLGNLTYNIIKNDHESVATYAIEFWNQAADEEIERLKFPGKVYRKYTETASASLIPLLLERIHFMNEDLDDWTVYKACSSTLGSISAIIQDRILEYVGEYIALNLINEHWHKRSAAALIIGSIAECIHNSALFVKVVYINLLNLTSDPVLNVRETASWAISKICEFHGKAVYESNSAVITITGIFKGLNDKPKIAVHSCWTIVGLFSLEDCKIRFNENEVESIIDKLIHATMRSDINNSDNDLMLAIWAAIIRIFEEVSDHYYNLALEKIPFFLNMLDNTINIPESLMIQSQICSIFHAIFGKTQHGMIEDNFASRFIDIILRIFNSRGTVIEEGLQAIGALADNHEKKFDAYTESVMPFVNWSLQSSVSPICRSALILTGDISRALGSKFDNYIENILPKIFNILKNMELEFDTKIRAIETLTDMSSHCTLKFMQFLPSIMKFISEASRHSLDLELEKSNPDYSDHLLELREAIISFYIGLAQGLNENNKKNELYAYLAEIMGYGLAIMQPQYRPNDIITSSFIGLVGDLTKFLGKNASSIIKSEALNHIINHALKSQDQSVREVAEYADKNLKNI
ncbi:hypothetical protein SteCoe_23670 [Stentor coeruleus]|uniref:Importin N-terminal domain-containing protein n=1 Tax=Stentor coeruleus TaxID=5963 RepID=A0A1R2BJ95_9CILI|nr:hypothetical protein SteCoe_23670 [Stentor coeruleus]